MYCPPTIIRTAYDVCHIFTFTSTKLKIEIERQKTDHIPACEKERKKRICKLYKTYVHMFMGHL